MTDPASRSGDVVHQLTSSLSALLIGLQRLRTLATAGDRERTLALVDRLEHQVRGMAAVLPSLRAPASPAQAPSGEPGDHS
jgi:hypothetical protein